MTDRPLKAIRKHCLDCCCNSAKSVKFCTCDGINSSRCDLWPYRFGMRPATAKRKLGRKFLQAGELEPPDVPIEECGSADTGAPEPGAKKHARP